MIILENINEFFNEYPLKQVQCGHTVLTDYEKIFEVFDGSFGYLSYHEFKSEEDSEIFLGSYPLNGADLWKCKKCGKLKFFYTETGGHFPKTITIDVDFDKNYKSDPFAKSVSFHKDKVNSFIEKFGFNELKDPRNIQKFNDIHIIEKDKKYIFGYNAYDDKITFNVVANRNVLREIFEFEKS